MSCTYSIQGLMTMEEGHKVQPQGQDRGRARQQGSDTHLSDRSNRVRAGAVGGTNSHCLGKSQSVYRCKS